jgi:signal transduction histidine kinase
MRKKDGEIIDVEIAARIIAPNRFLAFVRDITERKKAENDLIRSKEHLRQLNTYIETIREAERLNVSREIHEELGQQLAVLKMDLSRLGKRIVTIEHSLGDKIIELLASINKMMDTVRKISSELRPGMLDDIGLMATLDWYCEDFTKRTGIKASFAYDISDDDFSKELNVGIFRIFQESLINVTKDSAAKKVDVSIRSRDQQLVLLIEDNGKGFDLTGDKQKTLGLGVMIERARMLNGSYNVNYLPGKGTTVEVCVPLSSPN